MVAPSSSSDHKGGGFGIKQISVAEATMQAAEKMDMVLVREKLSVVPSG